MDARLELLTRIKQERWAHGNLLGLLNVMIGRRIETADGQLISTGSTWRELAALLKKARWDKAAAAELALQDVRLPPREREKYWYAVIAHAAVGSEAAARAGDRLAAMLQRNSFVVSESP
jgi:hypothetical protein